MKVQDLKAAMDGQFAEVSERFEQIDQRFEQVDQRFEQVDRRFDELRSELEQKIAAEGVRTRRHFEVVFEQFTGEIRAMTGAIADQSRHTDRRVTELDSKGNTLYAAVDDHELRLRVLEHKARRQSPSTS